MTALRPIAAFAVVALSVSSAVVGCAPRRAPENGASELRSPSDFPRDFLLQQRLTFIGGEAEHSLQTALQRRGDHLVLIGLTPMGTRAFVVEQRGLEVTASSHLPDGESLPFPPRAMLLDIQRTLLPALEGTPPTDGTRRERLENVEIFERWVGGRLVERRFRPRPGRAADEVVVRYGGDGYRSDEAPGRIEILRHRGASRVVLETLAHRWL